mgnify:FL=1|jgi:hypothetical protein|tara:strand:+ start:1131 stop:1538 length:408 start_codon:yes stop_codon:yes gene_type:complete
MAEQKKDKPIKTIIDHIGRTVVGRVTGETKDDVTLFNPVIIHVQPDQQSGQLQVQSFPYIFMEFLKDKDKNNWTFSKTSISTSDVELDERIIQQYENINNPAPPVQQSQNQNDGEVIQLFDEEEEKEEAKEPATT